MTLTFDSAIGFIRQHPKLVVSDDYELVVQQTSSQSVAFNNGEKTKEFRDSFWWLQLRVFHRKRVGVASTVFCGEESLKTIVDNAFQFAESSLVDPWFRFPLWRAEKNSENLSPSSSNETVPEGEFLNSLYPSLEHFAVGLEEKYTEHLEERTIIRKTEKLVRTSRREVQKANLSLVNQGQSGFFRCEETRGFEKGLRDKKIILDRLLKKSERLKPQRLVNKKVPGKYVLHGSVFAQILKSLELAFNGYSAGAGKSVFSKLANELVASEFVTLVDNGTLKGEEGSHQYDLEGSPGQKTTLIEKGKLKTFLHDATSAARFNRTSSGNLILGEKNLPSIGVTNLYLEPSSTKLSELVSDMAEGVYVEGIERIERDATQGGKLRLLGYGWKVSNGNPVEPLGGLEMVLDPFEIIKKISAVASDLDFWGRYGSPSVFISDMPLR